MLNDVQYLTEMYHYFNKKMFNNILPQNVNIYMGRRKNTKGHFWGNSLMNRRTSEISSEININPDWFYVSDDISIAATLLHETIHWWDFLYGKPGKNGYHAKTWWNKMLELGLKPIKVDKLGFKVTHEIIPGGLFEHVAKEFLNKNPSGITWQTNPTHAEHAVTKTRKRRTKVYKYELAPGMLLRSEKKLEAGLVKHIENLIEQYD